ncbi:MAG TPA: methyltransferase domain-containing protein [Acidimicrobiia bacterium]
MTRPRGRPPGTYGVDAPRTPIIGATLGILVVSAGIVGCFFLDPLDGPVWLMLVGALMLATTAVFLHTTLRGKFVVWAELLDGLGLDPGETVLDMGCGRGAVLILAAQRLRTGEAIGIDLWRNVDQSGNDAGATTSNMAAAGVAERAGLCTGDMVMMPFADRSVDVVLSSLAIHNIPGRRSRESAVREALRVVRPGGRMMIVDIRHATAYADVLAGAGCVDVDRRALGWRYWYGGPWVSPRVVTATRPR